MTKSSESIALRAASAASKADTGATPWPGFVACCAAGATVGLRGTYGATRFLGAAFTWLGSKLGLGLGIGSGLGLGAGLGLGLGAGLGLGLGAGLGLGLGIGPGLGHGVRHRL